MFMMSSMWQHIPWGQTMGKRQENHWPWHQQASETTWAALYGEASTNTSLTLLSISQVSYYFQPRAFFRNTLQLHFTTEETEAQTVQLTWPEEGSSPNLSDSKSGVCFPIFSGAQGKEVWARERCGSKFLEKKDSIFQNPLQLAMTIWLSMVTEM